jgi:hypothetical protein
LLWVPMFKFNTFSYTKQTTNCRTNFCNSMNMNTMYVSYTQKTVTINGTMTKQPYKIQVLENFHFCYLLLLILKIYNDGARIILHPPPLPKKNQM